MTKLRTIDTHTHILTQETAALLRKAAPKVPVTITPDDAESALLDVGGVLYRPFPTGGFDIPRRLRDMDAAGVDVQVLSATPQTYLYNQDAGADGGHRRHPERPDGQAHRRPSHALHGDRHSADAGAGKGGRRTQACDDANSACAAP